MENFGKFCFGILAIIITVTLGGFVFMKLWGWLVVYALPVNEINFIQAIGLMFFFGYLKHKHSDQDKDETTWEKFAQYVFKVMGYLVSALALGWIITLFQ